MFPSLNLSQFPFNNDCSVNTSMLKDLKMGQLNVQFAPDMNQHVKKTLPPSLSGFPGEAEIKYYVKATVVRPKFYQENFRSVGLQLRKPGVCSLVIGNANQISPY